MSLTLVGPRKPLVTKLTRVRDVSVETTKMPNEIRFSGEFFIAQRTLLHVLAVKNNLQFFVLFVFNNLAFGALFVFRAVERRNTTVDPLDPVRTVIL